MGEDSFAGSSGGIVCWFRGRVVAATVVVVARGVPAVATGTTQVSALSGWGLNRRAPSVMGKPADGSPARL
jgi:hypothetical protein